MFVMMGEVFLCVGIIECMYDGIVKWLGWLSGGLMYFNIGFFVFFVVIFGFFVVMVVIIGIVVVL